MNRTLIKGIIFDFDGVLCDSYELHKQAFKLSLNSLGYIWCEKKEKIYEEIKNEKTKLKLDSFALMNLIDSKDLSQLNQKKQDFTQSLVSSSTLDRKVVTILKNIKPDIRIGIASDANKETVKNFLLTNCAHIFFDSIVTSEDVNGKTKPSPDVYTFAIKTLNLSPNSIVVFEDTEKGCEAARAAGIDNVQLCNFNNLSTVLEKILYFKD